MLRRSHDHHRDVLARLHATLPSRGNFHPDQDRHIMIRSGSRRHPSAVLVQGRPKTGQDHARRRSTLDNRIVDQSQPATPVLPIAIARPSSPALRPLLKAPINALQQQTASAEISIASDAKPCHTFRGFCPWRFALAGPPVSVAPPSWGRHPQTFTTAVICRQSRRQRCPTAVLAPNAAVYSRRQQLIHRYSRPPGYPRARVAQRRCLR